MLNATTEGIAGVGEALKLAALLDDRVGQPDKAKAAAWAEQVARHPGLTRDDLLDGVQAFYDQPHDRAMAVGDLISHARRLKRDRLAREDVAVQQARIDRNAQKALEDISAEFHDTVAGGGHLRVDTPELVQARDGLQTCQGKADSIAAIKAYLAALGEAPRRGSKAKEQPKAVQFPLAAGGNALDVACPWCHAAVGTPCSIPGTQIRTKPHPSRVEAVLPRKESA